MGSSRIRLTDTPPRSSLVSTRARVAGDDAEKRALRFLVAHGLRPVTRNYRCRLGEIDLIMRDGPCLVFVEVRYRQHNPYADAVLSVDRRKQQKLLRAAAMYVSGRRFRSPPKMRFDIVGIDREECGELRVSWLKDAFRPD